ncbi:nuclear transport factor 2 family protein [Spirosoma spitsbergense]|uniref:nuclear transport factor 2 family protein n=1 Tax=Spirosoma spitsbergense TaxID=431554 RepID=UPI0003684B88|nr:nuclear transport factor 2 family protein [Spirosoma spitsbergense]
MQQESINKAIVRDFYRRAVSQGDLAFAEEIIANDYIQHSLAVKPGKAGLLEALGYMKQMPKPATPAKPFLRLIAEGDYVVTNMSFDWGGKQKVVVDLFRLQDGKVAEHWDAMQDEPESTVNGNSMMDGSLPVDDDKQTFTNKKLVRTLYEQVFINRDTNTCHDLVATDLIQHIPEVSNGLVGLMDYLRQQPDQWSVEKVHHIIGEGDFVVVQSSGRWEQKPTMFYDVVRLSDGKVVEQWGVRQRIE